MGNSDQENTAENQMTKAVGCVMGIGAAAVLLIVGIIFLIVKAV